MLTSPENAALFSQLIARTAQDVDILIDSLPNQEYTPEKQVGLVIVQLLEGSCVDALIIDAARPHIITAFSILDGNETN